MRPEDRVAAYLWDMLDAARTVRQIAHGVTLDQHLGDRKLQLAVERAVEIIGQRNVLAPDLISRLESLLPPPPPEIHG